MLRASVFHAIGLSLERMVFPPLMGLAFVWLPVWVIHSLAWLRGLMGDSVADVGLG
jgi:hypothetical protein